MVVGLASCFAGPRSDLTKNINWLTSKDKTDPNFDQRVAGICEAYREAITMYKTHGIHTICIDEQTGIEALE